MRIAVSLPVLGAVAAPVAPRIAAYRPPPRALAAREVLPAVLVHAAALVLLTMTLQQVLPPDGQPEIGPPTPISAVLLSRPAAPAVVSVPPPPVLQPQAKPKPVAEPQQPAPAPPAPAPPQPAQAASTAAAGAAELRATAEQKGLFDRVRSRWLLPPDMPADLSCEVLIELDPDGKLISVRIGRSSGNRHFDDSVVRAIYKSNPLPVTAEPGQARTVIPFEVTLASLL
jgi:TonB family protein